MIHKFIQLAAIPMIAAAASLPPPAFGVSADLHPAQTSISNPWATTARPLARVQDDRRHYVDFVANEVIIITANESDILPLLPKGGANRLLTKVLSPKGDPNYPAALYLISVDSSAVSTTSLVTDIRKIDPLSTGNLLFSSTGALKTLALAAHEQASGVKATLNYVLRPADYGNWTGSDGVPPIAPDNVYYGSDPFQWPYNCQIRHAADPAKCVQNIGVAAAWRALYFAGKLSNRVNVNIYDSGFAPNRDFPPGYQILPASSINEPGPGSCPSGPCPFHGTDVAMAGFAVPDNGFGGTGPGGPVAQLTMVASPNLDLIEIIKSIWDDLAQLPNTRILNLSFSADIPTALCIGGCQLMDLIGDGLRAAGMLVVASAGNDGSDVDDRVGPCPLCVETAKTIPCEISGVLCVGGIGWNSTGRHSKSNWGTDSTNPSNGGTVRLFAPFDVFMYDQHYNGNITDGIYLESGTSYSAPFVAGVAALVWAANPSLSPDDVENILIATAHKSTDTTVNRYVDAFSAVKTALGGHLAPSIVITSPAPNQTRYYDQYVSFVAKAIDEDTGSDISSSIQWTSDEPGEGPTQTTGCPGQVSLDGCTWVQEGFKLDPTHVVHTFTAKVVYNGYAVQAAVQITIIDYPLTLRIVSPAADGSYYYAGNDVVLGYFAMRGTHAVPSTDITWTVQNLDPACPANCVLALPGTATGIPGSYLKVSSNGSPGSYRLILNCQGQSAFFTLTIYPKSPVPAVTISSPLAGQVFYAQPVGTVNGRTSYQVTVHLAGSATDYLGRTIPGINLTWFQDSVVGSGVGSGNAIDYPVHVEMIGTSTNPVLVPIILRAISFVNGLPSSATATVMIKIVTL